MGMGGDSYLSTCVGLCALCQVASPIIASIALVVTWQSLAALIVSRVYW